MALWLSVMGSIPAGAGEPSTSTSGGHTITVYPRGCGGTEVSRCFVLRLYGLSPRVRGNLLPVQVLLDR